MSQATLADGDVEKQDGPEDHFRSHGDTPRPSHEEKEGADGAADGAADGTAHPPEKKELKEWECYDKLGYSYPWWKKWGILSIIFCVQVSMNWNASFYASSILLYAKHLISLSRPDVRDK